MSRRERHRFLTENYGAVLLRASNHEVWRLPNGRNFVCASTPSDHREIQNMRRDLRRAMNNGV